MKNFGWLFIPALIVFLTFSFFYFRNLISQNNSQQSPNPQTNQATESSVLEKTFHIEIVNKKLLSGQNIQVKVGESVALFIKSDEDEELHLHGYDKSVDLAKDKEVELKFVANLSGRFSFELEKSKTDLGVLEVLP